MKKKLLIILGAVIVIIIVAYVITGSGKTSSSQSASPLVSTETGQSAALPVASTKEAQQSNDLVALLRSVSTLSINPAVFSNPVYKALGTDTLVLPEPTVRGRVNPFAAIGASSAPVVASVPVGGATVPVKTQ